MKDTKTFILRDSDVRGRCTTYLNMQNLEDELLEVVIRPYKKNRSLAQNNLMWMWLTQIAKTLSQEHGVSTTPDNLKEEFQERWLGKRTYVRSDGSIGECRYGTSGLTTSSFTDFLDQLDIWAGTNLGIQLPHPEDLYREAMGPDKGRIR